MLDFNKYLMRYGEFGVQALIEKMERYAGIQPNTEVPLEIRWAHLMRDQPSLAA